jgi:hypothetical protein
MASTITKDFLTDEEMSRLEGGGGSPDFISDEEMAKLEAPKEKSILGNELDRLQTATDENKKYGQPLRAIANVGEMAGSVGNIGMKVAGDMVAPLGRLIPQSVKTGVSNTVSPLVERIKKENAFTPFIKAGVEQYQKFPEPVREVVGSGVKIASVIPGLGMLKDVKKIVNPELGELALKGGKRSLLGDMKITNVIAKKGYGKDLIDKKKNIANTIYEHGLTHGDMAKNAENAVDKASEFFNKADEIGQSIAADPNSIQLNPLQVVLRGIDPKKLSKIGKTKQAQTIIDNIIEGMADEGFDADGGIDKLIAAKRRLDEDGTLFKNGPPPSPADAMEQAIYKKMYLNLVDAIGEVSPEIKALNVEGKKLLDAHAALNGAASRIANKENIGLSDWLFGGGATGAALIHPGSLAVTLPLMGAKKAIEHGRGSNMLLNIGRSLTGGKEKTVEDILSGVKKPPPALGSLRPPVSQGPIVPRRTGDPFEAGLLSPEQNKQRLGALKLQEATPAPELPDYNPNELLSPEDYARKRDLERMDEATGGNNLFSQGSNTANQAKLDMRKKFGFNGEREIKMENLSPKKQMELNKYADEINSNPEMQAAMRESGLIGEQQDVVHVDDVVQWINEASKPQKPKLGMLGNERGSIGVENQKLPDNYKNAYEIGKQLKEKNIDVTEAINGMHGPELQNKLDRVFNNHDQSTFFEIGNKGKDLPEYVTGDRYGDIPTNGRSANYRDNAYEKGVSLMNLTGEKPTISAKMYETFNKGKREKQKYGGWLVGYGADGEPLILGAHKINNGQSGNSGAFSKLTNDIRGNTGLKMLAGTAAGGVAGLTAFGALQGKKK